MFDRLVYNPVSGLVFWEEGRKAGQRAGSDCERNGSLYREIRYDGVLYLEHRLVFFMMMGRWPIGVDHVDRNGRNNKWRNLREARQTYNNYNTKTRADNTSGRKGVYWQKGRWMARIRKHGKYHSAYFDTFEEAVRYREHLEILHAGEFRCT